MRPRRVIALRGCATDEIYLGRFPAFETPFSIVVVDGSFACDMRRHPDLFVAVIGNLDGFFGPTLIGLAREAMGSFTLGLMVSAATLLALTLFVLLMCRRAPVRHASV